MGGLPSEDHCSEATIGSDRRISAPRLHKGHPDCRVHVGARLKADDRHRPHGVPWCRWESGEGRDEANANKQADSYRAGRVAMRSIAHPAADAYAANC